MSDISLIYFQGCPKYEEAKATLEKAGVKDFVEVCQDKLPREDWRRQFSSPTILRGKKVIYGSKADGFGSCSAGPIRADVLRRKLD